MDLLNEILRHPVDPDYAEVAARPGTPPRQRWAVAAVAVLCGVMFAISGVQTVRAAPAIEKERSDLIGRIGDQQARQAELQTEIADTSAQVNRLRADALGNDAGASALRDEISAAEMAAAAVDVTGPGVVVEVSDAPAGADNEAARVVDLDLQQLVNGLWYAGAEAVAINGHRISSRTAIRGAGDAVTVNYVSLTSPYKVEAIGDPRTLEARFAQSQSGHWWDYLRQNYGMGFSMNQSKDLHLAGDTGQQIRHAKGK